MPPIRYDDSLPVHARRAEIAAAIATSPVVIVSGATGSGKSTQLPKICLELGRGLDGMIGHTQPRRLAAHALASRLAAELGTQPGDLVGYQVRFVDRTGPRTLVKLMTDGVLLRELECDPMLARYDTLILDEAHERNLNLDFLLGICRRLVLRRPDLKVVITSATIETRRFAEYFGDVPVIDVEGRSYPVEVRYRPPDPEDESPAPLAAAVLSAAVELAGDTRGRGGDTLVFLPGERQIQESLEVLRRDGPAGRELLPLFARLSSQEQERIFAPHAQPRIILATNVAETSLTVPGVRFVVDSGLARISRYSPRAKLQRLPIEPISRASAEQRKGRCGREGAGICIRLYSEEDYAARPEFTEPEIRRTNLASLILQMAALRLGAPEEFPFLDPPDGRLLNDGYRLLSELSAVDGERRITRIGRRMARLPVDPRLARTLVESARLGCLPECLVIAAFLSIQDPRERPAGRQEAADERHAAFADLRSDFVTVLNLWREAGAQTAAGARALRRWCRDNFLSWPRVREWQDLHQQLAAIARSPGSRARAAAGSLAALHRALLAGFLGGIGVRDDERGYLGARDTRFVIAPGTPLARRRPHWVMAASLVETGRVYARMVAQVQPSWIEAAAGQLVRRSYADAEWSVARGMVLARETVTLYGRVLHAGRLVDFSRIDPVTARRVFVEEALVRDRGGPPGAFRGRNAAVVSGILALEARLRRRDLLVGEAAIAEFFLERIPPRVCDLRGFRRWWREAEARHPRLLDLPRERLLARPLPDYAPSDFPDRLMIEGNALELRYVFDPTAEDDGATLVLPLVLLPLVRARDLDWLVPGMLREKVIATLRRLPKDLRRALVPIPDAADRFLAARGPAAEQTLCAAIAAFVTAEAGAAVTPELIAAVPLPPWLSMNVAVVDGAGRVLGSGRDLGELRRALRGTAAQFKPAPADGWQRSGVRRWDFGDLPAEIVVVRDGVRLGMYPSVEDRGDSVSLALHARAATAETCTRRGLTRLAALALPQQHALVRRNAAEDRELTLWLAAARLGREIYDELADRAVASAVLGEERLPRDAADFADRVEAGRGDVVAAGDAATRIVRTAAQALAQTRTALAALPGRRGGETAAAIEAGLTRLTSPGWVRDTPEAWFRQLPKYAQAALRRVARLREDPARDRRLAAQLEPWERALQELESTSPGAASDRRVIELRWGIEEFRLSLYAQELRTRAPISAQRLDALLRAARSSAD
ncbi:MAG TPA: ATP-dependent RNA helicase HrpA [Burkholderiales bacterium]|nr:ATP-dependent RNA helicase HrpA [Burkholderiales bacterium]